MKSAKDVRSHWVSVHEESSASMRTQPSKCDASLNNSKSNTNEVSSAPKKKRAVESRDIHQRVKVSTKFVVLTTKGRHVKRQ